MPVRSQPETSLSSVVLRICKDRYLRSILNRRLQCALSERSRTNESCSLASMGIVIRRNMINERNQLIFNINSIMRTKVIEAKLR